jgi:hypothetical protein
MLRRQAVPLVNIALLKGKSPAYIKAVADGVNSAVIETMGFPEDDRYQIITEHEAHCLEYQARTVDRGRSGRNAVRDYAWHL